MLTMVEGIIVFIMIEGIIVFIVYCLLFMCQHPVIFYSGHVLVLYTCIYCRMGLLS